MLSQNNNRTVIESVGDSVAVKTLIIKAKKGDKNAFGELYTILYKPLYRYVYSRSSDEDLALDLVQQTFLKFYEALDSYEPEKSPLAYLYTIAKRLLINHWEKKTFEPFDETLLDTLKEDDLFLDDIHVRNLADTINSFLPRLTDDEQEVIRLYFYAELEYKEIAVILSKEEPTIRKIKERALKKLRVLTTHLNEGH
jgi:RNA polymerase sigma-70 factor (ECF subfamily)